MAWVRCCGAAAKQPQVIQDTFRNGPNSGQTRTFGSADRTGLCTVTVKATKWTSMSQNTGQYQYDTITIGSSTYRTIDYVTTMPNPGTTAVFTIPNKPITIGQSISGYLKNPNYDPGQWTDYEITCVIE